MKIFDYLINSLMTDLIDLSIDLLMSSKFSDN